MLAPIPDTCWQRSAGSVVLQRPVVGPLLARLGWRADAQPSVEADGRGSKTTTAVSFGRRAA